MPSINKKRRRLLPGNGGKRLSDEQYEAATGETFLPAAMDEGLQRNLDSGTLLPRLQSINLTTFHHNLIHIAEPLRIGIANANLSRQQPSSNFSLKHALESLLPQPIHTDLIQVLHQQVLDFALCCAALVYAVSHSGALLSSVPGSLSDAAKTALLLLGKALVENVTDGSVGEMSVESALALELMPHALPRLKRIINESCIDFGDESMFAASAKVPVGSAVLAALQLRWLVTQVEYPFLGKLCPLVIPCALTALDHWSPEVKDPAIISFTHLVKNVNVAELGVYEDVILDASCQNIPPSDELWDHIVEMSIIVLTVTQRKNPRSPWFEKILNQMLDHLERQPKNTSRRIPWLKYIDRVFDVMGLLLVAHFRRIFPLFFLWLHEDDDETVKLVLERISTILKVTWVRKSAFSGRLVDELILVYKESATRPEGELVCTEVVNNLKLLKQTMNQQAETVLQNQQEDPSLRRLWLAFHDIEPVTK